MKRLIILLIILLTGAIIYFMLFKGKNGSDTEKNKALILQTQSSAFSEKVNAAMSAYFDMKDAFIEFDTAKVKTHASLFLSALDSIPLSDLSSDTSNASLYPAALETFNNIKFSIQALLTSNEITEMRKNFSMASDLIYPGFLKMINYNGPVIYLQHCPMAFYDTIGANWISNSRHIMNPYLGKFDPKYKSGMLRCGEVMDSTGTLK